mmetsp:Transcript_6181/g.17658  ORF Transcript_6181/g.17658 Transcript_6181/m.17658 type:complete len:117 (-) Transcript_6181:292-642(-)
MRAMDALNVAVPIVCMLAMSVGVAVLAWRRTKKPMHKKTRVVVLPSMDRIFPELRNLAGDCVVCLEEMEDGQACRRLHCGHCFHAECIDRWLLRSCSAMVCPTCRRLQLAPEDVLS